MAKDKAKPAPVEEKAAEDFNLSGAIREAFQVKGLDATRDEVTAFISEKYGKRIETDYNATSFGTSLSSLRKKLKGGDTGTTTVKKTTTASSAPSGQDMLSVMKFLAENEYTPSQLLQLLDKVAKLGTLEHIRATVKLLDELDTLKGK